MFSAYDPYTCSVTCAGDFKLTGYTGCEAAAEIYANPDPDGPAYTLPVRAAAGSTIAMSKDYAFGTVVYIDGLGFRTVEDRGGAVTATLSMSLWKPMKTASAHPATESPQPYHHTSTSNRL
jgi:3D (Asp-Asp-Asp) domain-containing protein